MGKNLILFLSIPLLILIVISSCIGIFTPGFYVLETENWQVQSIGQDYINLFLIAPVLLITSIFANKVHRNATAMWGGTVIYLTYTFVLYCFDVHFNKLFLVYCWCLGLSFYSMIWFLHSQFTFKGTIKFDNLKVLRVTAIYFIIVAVLFYFLWLAEIVPSIIKNAVPKSVVEAGLFTNGVHVLDLAVMLPGILIAGVFLLMANRIGFVLAPALLMFFILMDITIATLAIMMYKNSLTNGYGIAVVMSVFAVISAILLKAVLSNIFFEKEKNPS